MNTKKRLAAGFATVAAAGAIALATPSTASAAPVESHPVAAFGSVALCFGVPVGPVTISICL